MKYYSFLLLFLASIATASFQGNGNSMVVQATDVMRPSYGGRVLVRRSDDLSRVALETTEKICGADEQDGTGIKKRYNGQRIDICEWVAMKPKRCRRKIRRKGETFRLKKHCKCTCKKPTTNPAKTSCPTETMSPEIDFQGMVCAVPGQECGYKPIATGCKASEYMCLPTVSCYCGPDLTYSCHVHMTPPGVVDCPAPPRPPPADWEDPPPGIGERCDPQHPPVGAAATITL